MATLIDAKNAALTALHNAGYAVEQRQLYDSPTALPSIIGKLSLVSTQDAAHRSAWARCTTLAGMLHGATVSDLPSDPPPPPPTSW